MATDLKLISDLHFAVLPRPQQCPRLLQIRFIERLGSAAHATPTTGGLETCVHPLTQYVMLKLRKRGAACPGSPYRPRHRPRPLNVAWAFTSASSNYTAYYLEQDIEPLETGSDVYLCRMIPCPTCPATSPARFLRQPYETGKRLTSGTARGAQNLPIYRPIATSPTVRSEAIEKTSRLAGILVINWSNLCTRS